ncbi:MORN repeat-containing protein 3 isoform X2 [Rhinolophus ferrumequinum]|uniref:MORN repeat-containing protein 3 isoform X2 n=1 Tax=Rhinolophus ferrumequinum TaxID=59479 RepID=UPI00140FEA87|nr:MORN repeat-containing protein 3 isoform X2 [Rhinolophus ferrumequinum]
MHQPALDLHRPVDVLLRTPKDPHPSPSAVPRAHSLGRKGQALRSGFAGALRYHSDPGRARDAGARAAGCGRGRRLRPHCFLPETPDPGSAPQVSAGKGTQIWKKKGAIYEGDWKFGKRDGYGTLSLPDQETGKYRKAYSGWWKGDKKSGYGIQFFGPKEYYEGEWCGNQRSGWGRMYYSNGNIYEGQWRNDKPDGEGMLRLKNGNRYEGYWQRGLKNGSGRFFHLDHGQLFEGFWVDDVAKCGTMIDFGRDEAPEPTQFPIPEIKLLDPDSVLEEAFVTFKKTQD